MTRAHLLRGSKEQIAGALTQIEGEITEAIVFVEEPAGSSLGEGAEDIFAEMEPFAVSVGDAHDTREAFYNPDDGESRPSSQTKEIREIPQKVLLYAAKSIDPPPISDDVPHKMPFVPEGE